MGTLDARPWVVALTTSLAMLGACTGAGSTPTPASPASATTAGPPTSLIFRSDRGVSVVDATDGRLILDAPQAMPSPDFATIATASASDGTTTIGLLDAVSGVPMVSSDVDGALELRAVSAFDGTIALTPVTDAGGEPWAPTPRSTTHITVATPGDPTATERFDLRGNFEPEAFSDDGESLYMLEYRPALNPTTYRVTRLYLEKDKVWPVFGPDKRIVENMTATRLQQTLSQDGNTLYTLYTNQPPSYLSGTVVEDADERAFVHTLELRDGFAVCIELPASFGDLTPDLAGIAVDPAGRFVYAVDARDGLVVTIDADRLQVSATSTVDLSGIGTGPLAVRLSPDGHMLLIGGSEGVVAFDTGSMRRATTAPTPGGVTGLAFDDAGSLFVSWDGGIAWLDAATLHTRHVLPSPASGGLEFAEAVAG